MNWLMTPLIAWRCKEVWFMLLRSIWFTSTTYVRRSILTNAVHFARPILIGSLATTP